MYLRFDVWLLYAVSDLVNQLMHVRRWLLDFGYAIVVVNMFVYALIS